MDFSRQGHTQPCLLTACDCLCCTCVAHVLVLLTTHDSTLSGLKWQAGLIHTCSHSTLQ